MVDKDKLQKMADEFGLDLIVLFGSSATGKTHKGSDVDIAVKAEKKLDILELAKIQLAFSEALGRGDVEVVDIRSASPLLLRQLTEQGQALYAKDPDDFARLRMYAFKIYVETKPLREYGKRYLENFINNRG